MCTGIALDANEVLDSLVIRYNLSSRKVSRGQSNRSEYHFLYNQKPRELPVWYEQKLHIIKWGDVDKNFNGLPQTAWCKKESLLSGSWAYLKPVEVVVPAEYVLDKGVWYHVPEGIKAIVVFDKFNVPYVYILTQVASHYYQVMTRNKRMPLFVGDSI